MYEVGVNYVADALPGPPVLVTSWQECCAACEARRDSSIEQADRCNVWTFHAASQACQLKNTYNPSTVVADAAYTAGRVCAPACASDQFEAVACGAGTDRVCSWCSQPQSCRDGFFESAACSASSDRVCSPCSGCAATAGYLEAAPCHHECEAQVRPRGAASAAPPACTDGTYRNDNEAVARWVTDCPGFSLCQPGAYCNGVSKLPCPPGRFGGVSGITDPQCEGPCAAGHFCPQHFDSITQLTVGSTLATQYKCGGVGVYCPEGSSTPTTVAEGRYTLTAMPGGASPREVAPADPFNLTRSSTAICEPGYWCSGGVRQPCPPGRYGSSKGLATAACDGECMEGWFCPSGSTSPKQRECGPPGDVLYCPAGSGEPQPTYKGLSQPTPPGGTGGFYTTGTEDEDDSPGPSNDHRTAQHLCPLGHYCQAGVKHPCPRGRWGGTLGMVDATCSGVCRAGYYCPAGSVSPTEVRCGGNVDSANANDRYCPTGSWEPTPVSEGHYTVGGNHLTRVGQVPCEAGLWCTGGERYLCNQGHYGAARGMSHPDCSGLCEQGYYCTKGSTDPRQHECGGAGVYCPEGSFEPHPVYTGYYTVRVVVGAEVAVAPGSDLAGKLSHPQSLEQFKPPHQHRLPGPSAANSNPASPILSDIVIDTSKIRTTERLCEEGSYCMYGEKYPCPPGRWGGERRLHNDLCSGNCSAGYICPQASTRPTQVQCGGNDRYCLPAAWQVTPVSVGYYTTGGGDDGLTRDNQTLCEPGWYCRRGVRIKCPAGRYGATYGLSTAECTGPCEAGYYCPEASTRAQQIECGDETVFCPEASQKPVGVYSGYYTVGGRNQLIPSDRAMYCRNTYGPLNGAPAVRGPFTLGFDRARYCTSGQIGDNATRATQKMCEPGHFCVAGLRYECPPGRYGSSAGETQPQCTGQCPDGYYCPWASTSQFQRKCGAADLYCPTPAGAPTPVSKGYYTVADTNATTRWRQQICPKGWYCTGGEKWPCPPGRYGDTQGLSSRLCTGLCAPGYYCPVHSVNHTQVECGHVGVYCPIGSSAPTKVLEGYYTTGGFENIVGRPENTTRTWFELCEPGHYCTGGIKRQCPSGVWGNETGVSDPGCNGICPAGYFCPPYTTNPYRYECGNISLPTSDEAFTADGAAISGGHHGAASVAGPPGAGDDILVEWDDGVLARQPSASIDITSVAAIHTFALRGGPASVFCPVGSSWPTPVRAGYYTLGAAVAGDARNTTRDGERPCEKGWFCVAGRKYPCPPGVYGDRTKLQSRYCSAWCPPGFFCPLNSTSPTECPPNHYSSGGYPKCMECPTPEPPQDPRYPHIRPRCRTGRLCCNY